MLPISALALIATVVVIAGGYRLGDFIRIGLPLNIIIWIAASLTIPLAFPPR